MLDERRRELRGDVDERRRSHRTDQPDHGRDDLDVSDAAVRSDLEQALLQMRVETLARVEHALTRIDEGDYGTCVVCGEEIAEQRLRALPFAVRCRDCEQAREDEQDRTHPAGERTDRRDDLSDELRP